MGRVIVAGAGRMTVPNGGRYCGGVSGGESGDSRQQQSV